MKIIKNLCKSQTNLAKMSNAKPLVLIILLIFLLFIASFLSLSLGEFSLSLEKILQFLLFKSNDYEMLIFYEVRLPRVLGAIFIGASLALSGALYQGVIGNPLVSPGILGVLNGASFGASLGMLLNLNLLGIEFLCFAFGLLAMGAALLLSFSFGRAQNILMLILSGIIISAFFGAGVSILKLLADPYNTLPNIVFWLMGSLAYIQNLPLFMLIGIFLFSFVICFLFSRELDLLNLDEESATALGINVKKLRIFFILIATILASTSVALGGMIGWIGLVIPHIARILMGANHRLMLIFNTIFGALFLLICDTLARTLMHTEIPIGILTSVLLIPIFSFLLILKRRF